MKCKNIEDATEIATTFIKKAGYPYYKVTKVEGTKRDFWVVTINVALTGREMKVIHVDPDGSISRYE